MTIVMTSSHSSNLRLWIFVICSVVVNVQKTNGDSTTSDDNSNLWSKIIRDIRNEALSEEFIPPEESYDFIVVGAGTGGCTIANRLTEVSDWDVLLIEAGGDENFINDIPLPAHYQQQTPVDWQYKSEPSNIAALGLVNNQSKLPRGKIMGGSSVLSYMEHVRGNKNDYDNWEALGNTGWGYKDVLKYFKKSEDNQIPGIKDDNIYHSTGGPLSISHSRHRTAVGEAFVEAGLELGNKYVDYNGEFPIGFSYFQYDMKDGSRWSAARAFIDPVRSRSNLHIRKRSFVTKILLDDTKTAIGVEFVHGLKKYAVKARKEVILAAGAINTPQLLMLSGVGPADHLEEVGISLVQNLSVGYNLMDHVASGPCYFVNDSVAIRTDDVVVHFQNIIDYFSSGTGPLTMPAATEAVAFLDPENPDNKDNPTLELVLYAITFVADPYLSTAIGVREDIYRDIFLPYQFTFGWFSPAINLHPKSRGRILLKSDNPTDKPLIFLNHFSNEDDLDVIVSGIKEITKLAKTNAFQKYGSTLYKFPIPACSQHEFESDEYWKCYARHITLTVYHQSGTCKMGPFTDPDAVVDPRLKVYGVSGLRVVDASIFPVIPAGHTNAVVFMVAEKAGDLIKEDWGKETEILL